MRKVLINLTTSKLNVHMIDIVNTVKGQVKSMGEDICNTYSKDSYQHLCGTHKFKFDTIRYWLWGVERATLAVEVYLPPSPKIKTTHPWGARKSSSLSDLGKPCTCLYRDTRKFGKAILQTHSSSWVSGEDENGCLGWWRVECRRLSKRTESVMFHMFTRRVHRT